ncbi:MAG: YeeE/YedE family protein [Rhodospirillales bacterium]
MIRAAAGLASGALFGGGILVSGMINPERVLGFLDVTGRWDPTLAFVMAGAVLISALGYLLSKRMPQPFLDSRFHFPDRKSIDPPLVVGAVIFGIGWGLVGLCPGPALAGLGSLNISVFIFVGAMLAGMVGWRVFDRS